MADELIPQGLRHEDPDVLVTRGGDVPPRGSRSGRALRAVPIGRDDPSPPRWLGVLCGRKLNEHLKIINMFCFLTETLVSDYDFVF